MLCYVKLCYVMLCYVMLCYVMLCYVMLCYVMLCYVMLCYVCYVFSGPKVMSSDFSTATPLQNGATIKYVKNGYILLVNDLM